MKDEHLHVGRRSLMLHSRASVTLMRIDDCRPLAECYLRHKLLSRSYVSSLELYNRPKLPYRKLPDKLPGKLPSNLFINYPVIYPF